MHWFNRGTLRLKMGESRAAIEDYTEALRLESTYAEAYSSRGIALKDIGDSAGARRDFDAAIRLDPTLPAPWYFRGLIRNEAGDATGARDDLRRALEVVPRNSPQYGETLKLLRQIGASLEESK